MGSCGTPAETALTRQRCGATIHETVLERSAVRGERSVRNDQFLTDVKSRLGRVFADRLRGVVLYGSRARDDATEDSDIDLLVLLDPPVDLGPDLDTIVRTLYPVQLDLEHTINALPIPYPSYEAGEFGLYRNAQREGIRA